MNGNFRIDEFVKLGGLALVTALAGCAGPAPQVVTRTVTVEVPVGVPCRAPQIDRPVWPLDVLPADADDYEWTRAALAEIEMREAYEARLEGAAEGCR
jgi:hypothetical protein